VTTPTYTIEFDSSTRKYRLVLPADVIEHLCLKDTNEQPLQIEHENKMELEWIAEDVMKRHGEYSLLMDKKRARAKVKMWCCAAILILVVIAGLLNQALTGLLKIPANIFRVLLVITALFAAWQLVVTYLLRASGRSNLLDTMKTIQLRETIEEKFQ